MARQSQCIASTMLSHPIETNPEPTFSPLRNRHSFLSLLHPSQGHDQAQDEKKEQKQVHWGPIIEIPIQFLSPSPPIKPGPEPEPEPEPEPKDLSSMSQTPKSTPNPKPILKQPTLIDHETLYKSLWEMVYQAEEKVRRNNEYLHIAGDEVLDAWFLVEEHTMRKRANRVARTARERLGLPNIVKRRNGKGYSKKKKSRGKGEKEDGAGSDSCLVKLKLQLEMNRLEKVLNSIK